MCYSSEEEYQAKLLVSTQNAFSKLKNAVKKYNCFNTEKLFIAPQWLESSEHFIADVGAKPGFNYKLQYRLVARESQLIDKSNTYWVQDSKKAREAPKTADPLYRVYLAMISRCYNTANPAYHNYGGRGIRVCDRWRESFDHFKEDMGCRPSDKHSVDRVNNNGNYEPSNCRWSTTKEQNINKRNTLFAVYKGHKIPLRILCDILGIAYSRGHYLLKKYQHDHPAFEGEISSIAPANPKVGMRLSLQAWKFANTNRQLES